MASIQDSATYWMIPGAVCYCAGRYIVNTVDAQGEVTGIKSLSGKSYQGVVEKLVKKQVLDQHKVKRDALFCVVEFSHMIKTPLGEAKQTWKSEVNARFLKREEIQ